MNACHVYMSMLVQMMLYIYVVGVKLYKLNSALHDSFVTVPLESISLHFYMLKPGEYVSLCKVIYNLDVQMFTCVY